MAQELWTSTDLMEVTYSDQAAPPDGFWLRFFPRQYTSEAQEIAFDKIAPRDRRLAPFVAPNVQGRVMRSLGREMTSFAPAYLKPKGVVDPSKVITRRRGEPPAGIGPGNGTGTLSLEQRWDAAVADHLRDQRDMIERRWDHMACEAITKGQVLVEGEDYPTQLVDFKRDASLTSVIGAGVTWDETASDPLADIGVVRKDAFTLGRAPVRTLIFGSDAWSAFSQHESVQKLLDNMRRGSNSDFNTTGLSDGSPVEDMGWIEGSRGNGRLNLLVYSNEYEDEQGNSVPYMDPRDVVGVGGAIGGVMAFGAILDKRSLKAVPMFPKMWEEQDPSVEYVMTQSAPLPVPTNINNSFRIRALA